MRQPFSWAQTRSVCTWAWTIISEFVTKRSPGQHKLFGLIKQQTETYFWCYRRDLGLSIWPFRWLVSTWVGWAPLYLVWFARELEEQRLRSSFVYYRSFWAQAGLEHQLQPNFYATCSSMPLGCFSWPSLNPHGWCHPRCWSEHLHMVNLYFLEDCPLLNYKGSNGLRAWTSFVFFPSKT